MTRAARPIPRLLVLSAVWAGLLLTSCGESDDDAASDSTSTAAVAATTEEASPTTPATVGSAADGEVDQFLFQAANLLPDVEPERLVELGDEACELFDGAPVEVGETGHEDWVASYEAWKAQTSEEFAVPAPVAESVASAALENLCPGTV